MPDESKPDESMPDETTEFGQDDVGTVPQTGSNNLTYAGMLLMAAAAFMVLAIILGKKQYKN